MRQNTEPSIQQRKVVAEDELSKLVTDSSDAVARSRQLVARTRALVAEFKAMQAELLKAG